MSYQTTTWNSSSPEVSTALGEVHVWRCPLNLSNQRATELLSLLSSDELIRAGRFVFLHDRTRFVVARAFLRTLIGRYLRRPPDSLRFTYGPNGKPGVRVPTSAKPFGFNLSHAGEWAVCAIAPTLQIGVDIECEGQSLDVPALAHSCFSPAERESIAGVIGEKKAAAFLAGWTRKEAYLKSTGDGLQTPLTSFDVSLRPSEKPQILAINGDDERAEHWFMEAFQVADEGYAGALVIWGQHWQTRYRDFEFFDRGWKAQRSMGAKTIAPIRIAVPGA